ncbi:serine/threonine-protein kinase [Pyrus ussuriensis x Pyrus communis]|uniref:Serine/threonine-protein kinase n=1 Tax=Pyrus ussuriensis x Pyrus communis TaxID=2448454 RepID=A0A5N5H430_9ROSA|nr:putative serine/threonine-protein kinase [Pyrus x bretschneideri]KAB2622328.1 serine/threonine-protein kinase [Pyrus ussuriensis x Pyrus communis]
MKFPLPCKDCFVSSPTKAIERRMQDGQIPDNLRIFSCKELKSATNGFHSSNKLGEGGFGSVYKGQLRDGNLVAVKVLSVELESMRGEREFIAELAALSVIRHENLVRLQGCCVDGAARYLVYDYMKNNSLTHTLLGGEQNRMRFSWEARRGISIGVARGLTYLHEEVDPHILHRDIKSSNILLDENLTPKVGDFGLSKLLRDNHTHISTRVAGTIGYLAPEYAISGRLTRKSDTYSFGVLLLEIVSGRAVVDFDLQLGEQYLVQKVWEAHKDGNLAQLVDPTLQMNFPTDEAIRFLKVGLLCVQEKANHRPRMSKAVEMLSGDEVIKDSHISQPGLVSDFMDIKMRQDNSNDLSTFSKASTVSTVSKASTASST